MRRPPKTNHNVVYVSTYHVVWCPKYCRVVPTGPVHEQLGQILEEVTREGGTEVLEMEILPDHVHFLVDVDPKYGIDCLVKHMKGRSSHILRDAFPTLRSRLPTLWTNRYFVATVGGAPLTRVQSIDQQRHA